MLAVQVDVEARLGRPLTVEETARVDGLLTEASAAVAGWLRHTPDPVPAEVAVVASRMVARAFSAGGTEPGLTQVQATMGPFGVTRGFSADATSGGIWMTRQDKMILQPFRRTSRAENVGTSRW